MKGTSLPMGPLALVAMVLVGVISYAGLHLAWPLAIALGLGVGALIMVVTPGKQQIPGVMLLVVAVAVGFLSPQLMAFSVDNGTPETSVETFDVVASAVTSGITVNGNTIVVPIGVNATTPSVDKTNVSISFVAVRTDSGKSDANLVVDVSNGQTITDSTTGIAYPAISKDSSQVEKVYINLTGDQVQTKHRVIPLLYGNSTTTVYVTMYPNPTAFKYANNYTSVTPTITVGGKTFTVLLQKVNSTA